VFDETLSAQRPGRLFTTHYLLSLVTLADALPQDLFKFFS
jgi:hypothetical protein